MTGISSLEICAGGGGQALGLAQAGFEHEELVEIERHYCNTLRLNRPRWEVFEKDLRDFVDHDAGSFKGIDLLAGSLPCPPFFDRWKAAARPGRAQPVPGHVGSRGHHETSRRPKSNRHYWLPKLESNVARDAKHQAELAELGWKVLVILGVRRGRR